MAKEKVGYYDPETAKAVLDALRTLQKYGIATEKGNQRPANIYPARPILIHNQSGEIIPRFAVVQAIGTFLQDDQCYINVTKPIDSNGASGPYLINLFEPIAETLDLPTGKTPFGTATAGPHVNVLVDSAYSAGAFLRPEVGSWFMTNDDCGQWTMIGANDGAKLGGSVYRAVFNGNDVEATEIEVVIKSCIKYNTTTGVGYFGGTELANWRVIGCLLPAEARLSQNGFEIDFNNPFKLTAVAQSEPPTVVRLRRNLTDNAGGDATWDLVQVGEDQQVARWVTATYQGGIWLPSQFHEGADPTPCGPPDITCWTSCDCLDDGDVGRGHYLPETDQYEIISTASALDGPGEYITAVTTLNAGDECQISYATAIFKAFCVTDFPGGNLTPNLTEVEVVKAVSLDSRFCGNGLMIEWTTLSVCKAGGTGTGGSYYWDLCEYICLCCEWIYYILPEGCEPPDKPECDCYECLFEDNIPTVSIDLDGTPYTGTDMTKEPTNDCCWNGTAQEDPDVYIRVCYNGNGDWSVDLTGNATANLQGDGNCNGASVNDGGSFNTGSVQIQSQECVACNCCAPCVNTCLTISDTSGRRDDYTPPATFTLDQANWDQRGPDNGCCWDVPILWTIPDCMGGYLPDPVPGTATICMEESGTDMLLTLSVPVPNYCGAGGDGFSPQIGIELQSDPCQGGVKQECGNGHPKSDCDVPGYWEVTLADTGLPCGPQVPTAQRQITLLDSAGIPIRGQDRKSQQGPGIGDAFAASYPELFKRCGCSRDVVPLMNRWGDPDHRPNKQRVQAVAKLLAKKNGITEAEVTLVIAKFLGQFMPDEANLKFPEIGDQILPRLEDDAHE